MTELPGKYWPRVMSLSMAVSPLEPPDLRLRPARWCRRSSRPAPAFSAPGRPGSPGARPVPFGVSSSAWVNTCAGGASMASLEPFITSRRSVSRATSSMEWETIMMVAFFALRDRRWILPRISERPTGSRPAVGSSRMRTSGSMAMTPAMATRRFWPPESSKGDFSSMLLRQAPRTRRLPATRRSTSSGRQAHVLGAEGDVLVDRLLKQLVLRVLEHQPHLEPGLPGQLLALPRCPARPSSTVPEVGFSSPFSCWIRVDFPEPVWPMMPINSPRSTEK